MSSDSGKSDPRGSAQASPAPPPHYSGLQWSKVVTFRNHGVPAIAATTISGVFMHPVVAIGLRLQFASAVKGIPDIKSLPAATKQLFQQGVRTAYRGFSLRAVQSLFSGVQWGTYGVVRKATAEQRWGKDFWEGQSLMLATRMGITALKSPFEVVKDRMQVDPLLRAAVTGRGGAHSPAATGAAAGVAAAEGAAVAAKAPGPYAVMRELVRLEGVRGLWAGYPATVARDVVVAYIMLYGSDVFSMGITRAADAVRGVGAGTGAGGGFGGYLASTLQEERRGQGKHWLVSVGAGALSGLTSALLTQPLDLAKTVLQTQSLAYYSSVAAKERPALQYRGSWHVISERFREGGVRALYRGAVPRVAHLVVGHALHLPVFKWCMGQWVRTEWGAAEVAAIKAKRAGASKSGSG